VKSRFCRATTGASQRFFPICRMRRVGVRI